MLRVQKNKIELPPGDLLAPCDLAWAIAKALFPVKTTGIIGLEGFVSKDCRMLNPGMPFAIYKLTEEDEQTLAALLPDLPRVEYPVSKDDGRKFLRERKKFLEHYRRHSGSPKWEPVFITKKDINKKKDEQADCFKRHHDFILDEIQKGINEGESQFVGVGADREPVRFISIGTYITRDRALAYLNRLDIAKSSTSTSTASGVGLTAEPEVIEDWSTHAYMSEKLRKLFTMAERWGSGKQYRVETSTLDYRVFHASISTEIRESAEFKRQVKVAVAAERLVRPLYARREQIPVDCPPKVWQDFRTPELRALRDVSSMWSDPKKPPNEKEVVCALEEYLIQEKKRWAAISDDGVKVARKGTEPFAWSKDFLENAHLILMHYVALTGRHLQAGKKTTATKKS